MTQQELDYIIKEGENYLIEFKEQVNASIAKEIVAFANASGGRIFVGISDQGMIKGIEKTKINVMKSQIQDIARNCQPKVNIEIEVFETVLIVNILELKDKPCQCSEGFFIRLGPNSQKMSRNEIIEFIQGEGIIRFEEQINKNFDFQKHYESDKLERFLKIAEISKTLDDFIILENLGVLSKSEPHYQMNQAGVLFFSSQIATLCEQATLTCVLFGGKERIEVLNRKDYQSDLISNIEQALHFVRQELRVKYIITGDAKRKEEYEIPLEALREAIINAVSHRDYLQYGAHTVIEIFTDRIEITNPGGLPKGLNPKDFGKKSVRRNPIIAGLLQRAKMVENVGTGISRIKALLKASGCIEPVFEFSNFFTVIFQRKPGLGEKLGEKLGENEMKILQIIQDNSAVTIQELAGALGISTTAVENNLNKLKHKNLLKRVGGAKGGRWVCL